MYKIWVHYEYMDCGKVMPLWIIVERDSLPVSGADLNAIQAEIEERTTRGHVVIDNWKVLRANIISEESELDLGGR